MPDPTAPVLYASTHAQTAKIASRIAAVLRSATSTSPCAALPTGRTSRRPVRVDVRLLVSGIGDEQMLASVCPEEADELFGNQREGVVIVATSP